MANKRITDLTATTSLSSGDVFAIDNSVPNSRKITAANVASSLRSIGFDGAKVRKSANLTGQDIRALTAVTFANEDWDTGSYHDTGSNTDRLTVTNAGYYRVTGQIELANLATGSWYYVQVARYNSSNVLQEILGVQAAEISATTTVELQAIGTGNFSAGDFARMNVQTESDASCDITTTSYLQIERVG